MQILTDADDIGKSKSSLFDCADARISSARRPDKHALNF
jgi:hypothetical protein